MNQWARVTKFFAEGNYNLAFRELIIFLFAVDSIGSVFLRGGIWVLITIVVLVSMDTFKKDENEKQSILRQNLGFFLLFLVLGGTLMYLLFGFAPFVSTVNADANQ